MLTEEEVANKMVELPLTILSELYVMVCWLIGSSNFNVVDFLDFDRESQVGIASFLVWLLAASGNPCLAAGAWLALLN